MRGLILALAVIAGVTAAAALIGFMVACVMTMRAPDDIVFVLPLCAAFVAACLTWPIVILIERHRAARQVRDHLHIGAA